MPDMTAQPRPQRPLSPHWTVYRWQIGNSLSILHRLTGLALAVGFVVYCFWLVSLAQGPQIYTKTMQVLSGPVGLTLMTGYSFAFLYHLLNGARHLVWDAGYGFERRQRYASGWAAVVGALLFSALLCMLLIWRRGHA